MWRKAVSIWVCMLFILGILIFIDISFDLGTERASGTTIYVNATGDGGAYTSIQDAINASSDGDTVFVYAGTYQGSFIVNRSINLTGESRDTTIIDGCGKGDVVDIRNDWVNITGFTAINSGSGSNAGIRLFYVQNCTVINNNVSSNNKDGVRIVNSNNNIIINNIASYNNGNYCICAYYSDANNISDNIVLQDGGGIYLYRSNGNNLSGNNLYEKSINLEKSYDNIIYGNIIPNGRIGLKDSSDDNQIVENIISHEYETGINLESSHNNTIKRNTIQDIYYGITLQYSIDNNIVDNIVETGLFRGIGIYQSNGTTIMGNDVSLIEQSGIYISYSLQCNIIGNNVFNNAQGIYLYTSSSGNNVTGNRIYENYNGIYSLRASWNNIISNDIFSNTNYAFYISESSNLNIYHNNIVNNVDQVYDSSGKESWDNGYPSGGNYWSDYIGVDEYRGPEQDIPGRDDIGDTNYSVSWNSWDNYPLMVPFEDFTPYWPVHNINKDTYYTYIQDAIDDADMGNTIFVRNGTYPENVAIDKSLSLTGEDKNSTIIKGDGNGDVVFIDADWVAISDFTITGTGIYSGDAAIQVDFDYSNIYNNIISNNTWGIFLRNSVEHNVANNIVINNTLGIYLSSTEDCSITQNSMIEDGIALQGTLLEHWNTHAIDTSNTVNGKPVYYWKNRNGGTLPSGAGQVILANCQNINIETQDLTHGCIGIQLGFSSSNYIMNNNVTNNWGGIILGYSNSNFLLENYVQNNVRAIGIGSSSGNYLINNNASTNDWEGIFLAGADGNNITGNIVSDNNDYGILFVDSDDNTITNNTVSLNNHGIYLDSANNNWIYHNRFIENTIQAYDNQDDNYWDNGYPSGGNFWSDLGGDDYYNGPNQDVPGSDGIGDINYSIDSNSIDRYPLMIQQDTFAPLIQLISPVNNSIIQEGVILDFQINDYGPYYVNYSVNGGPFYPLPDPYDIVTEGLSDGEYLIQINAIDLAGNSNTSWYYFMIDSSQPMIHLDFPENNSVIQSGTILEFSVLDQNSIQANYSVNGDPAVSFSGSFDVLTEGWDEGYYSVQINVMDAAGNYNSSCYFFTIDSTKPIIVLNSPENNSCNPKGTILDFSVSDSNLHLANYSVIGGPAIPFNIPFDISTSSWPDDEYTIQINVLDEAGNFNSAYYFFTIDSTKPSIMLNSPYNGSHIPGGVYLDFTVDDANLHFVNYSINGNSNMPFVSPFNLSTDGWEDGNYSFLIEATDLAGNAHSAWFFFTLDSTPPSIVLKSPANNAVIQAESILNYSIVDANLLRVNYSVNGGSSAPFSQPFDVNTIGWSDGRYTIRIDTIDKAGNFRSSLFIFTIDSTKPSILLHSPLEDSIIKGGTRIDFSVIDSNLLQVQYSINGNDSIDLLEPYDILTDDWPQGNYSVLMESWDAANNFNSSQVLFTIDNTAPSIWFDPSINHSSLPTGQTIQIVVVGQDTEFVAYSIDGGENKILEEPYILYPYMWSQGAHIIQIKAEDAVGNEAVLWFEVKIDTISPYITYCEPPLNAREVDNSTNVVIAFSEPMNTSNPDQYISVSPTINFTSQWNEDGTVLSISFASDNLADGTTYTLNLDRQMADNNGNGLGSDFNLAFTTKGEPSINVPTPSSEPSSALYWGIIMLIIIMISIIILLFYMKRKTKESMGRE